MLKYLVLVFWILLLILFNKTKMHFYKFLIGSVGLFCVLMFIGRGLVDVRMQYLVALFMGFIGDITGIFATFPDYYLVTVYHGLDAISFLVDYECSGFIETLVYVSLIAFYPVYRAPQRFLYAIGGTIYIFISNIIRVFSICVIIRVFGTSLFYFSHTIFARLLFFGLTIILFYNVFTRPHILRQKVGDLTK